ncbi:hypothetical protein SDC9_92554 [bioreactor metagenome]|uniref:Uncharacterized protein n=1 Tax=bioreactor metagenome TaxID=1076179 RepID=A0A644ZYG5_9ZZZZ
MQPFAVGKLHRAFRGDFEHHGGCFERDAGMIQRGQEALDILRPRERNAEALQPEAVVNALVEDAARFGIALQQEDVFKPEMRGFSSGGKPRGACADDHQIVVFQQFSAHLTTPENGWSPARRRSICS